MQVSESHPFHRLLPAEIPALHRRARSLTHNEQRAQDLVQETLIRAWTSRDRYEPDTRLRAWLFTILRNSFLLELRRRRQEVEDVNDAFAARLWEGPAQEHAYALKQLVAAIALLPEPQRKALILVGGAGCSQAEAARACGCKVGTVKSRVFRARACLSENGS